MRRNPIKIIKNPIAGILIGSSIVILILFIGSFFESYSLEKEIDDIYSTKIYPEATNEINIVVQNMSAIQEPDGKLRILSRWIQTDFVFLYNNKSFKRDDKLKQILDYILTFGHPSGDQYYYSDSEGHRVIRTGNYSRDPLCITYYRAGACGEHALLAQYVSNLSGLETRIVGDPSGYHSWVEVNINDTWFFYDSTFPESYPLFTWFGLRSENRHNCVIADAARIFTETEDITDQYPPTGTLNISGLLPCDSLWLSWKRNESTYRYKLSSQNETLTIKVRPKTYTVEVSRLFFFSERELVNVTEGNVSKIQVFTEK